MIHRMLIFWLLILCGVNAQERCIAPPNKVGVCINIYSCKPIIDIIKSRPLSMTEFHDYLRSIQCGFEGNNPKVCCEQPVIKEETDPPDVSNHRNLPLLNLNECGPASQDRVLNGNKTGVLEYPWMALLFYDVGRSKPEYRCGGTLINKRYVLTAAHCVTLLPPHLRLIGIRLGEHDLSTERDCDKDEEGIEIICAERYQDIGIESTHVHPEFSNKKLQNDIALIRLDGDADLRPPTVRPICMPIGLPANMTLKRATVTGWGATEIGIRSQDLLQASLPIVSLKDCAEVYKKRAQIWYKQICAGGKKGIDSCAGDSGGPLQAPTIYNNNLRYIQHGIVSFGPMNCGTEGAPGVYTRVVYYMDWILNIIRE
ncbi:serine protease ea-like isoform X1 [Xylocopa sonorina]|uniref:serine protease ea-like isoform X1 n=1 Tax=Xylocopa sonorina TaxID=1818115 RepID=UPI00403B2CB1